MRRLEVLEFRDEERQTAAHLARGAKLIGYEALACRMGLDVHRMLGNAGLPLKALADPDTLISVDAVATLLEASARESGQDTFGLLLAETRRIGNLGVLAAVLREEPTLRDAVQSLARYICVQNGGLCLKVDDMGQFTMLFLDLKLRNQRDSRQGIEMAVAITLSTLRSLAHEDFRPVSICFRHGPPRSLDVHRRVLSAPIDFSQPFNAIVCRSRDLDLPVPYADPELGRAIKRRLDQDLTESKDAPLDRVRQIVRMLLPGGRCSVEQVAEQLGTHRRTLNRQLALAGESVSTVIDNIRAEMAQLYLSGGAQTLYQVGHLLGFSSGAEFSRWFRGRFGMTASEWVASRESGASQRERERSADVGGA